MSSAQTVDLKGETSSYQFRFGANAWCQLEEETGRTVPDLQRELSSETMSSRLARQFMRAGLVVPENPSLEETGVIIDDLGGLGYVMAMIRAALTPTAPVPDGAAA